MLLGSRRGFLDLSFSFFAYSGLTAKWVIELLRRAAYGRTSGSARAQNLPLLLRIMRDGLTYDQYVWAERTINGTPRLRFISAVAARSNLSIGITTVLPFSAM